MKEIALAIRFLLELASVAALAVAGWRFGGGGVTGIALGIAAPVLLVVGWGMLIAPRSGMSPIPLGWRTMAGALVILAVAGLLALAGERLPASVLAILVVVDTAALYLLGGVGEDG